MTFEIPRAFLEAKQKIDSQQPAPPAYGITEMRFEGRIEGDRAELQATLSIRVLKEGWIRVPLRMDRALAFQPIRDEHGQLPLLDNSENEGRVWWVEGIDKTEPSDNRERHLRLKLTLRVQTLAGEQMLLLSLPDAVPSELRLTVPLEDLVARYGNDKAAVKVNPVGDGETRITAGGLGERLELYWRPKAKTTGNAAPILETTGLMTVDVDDETVRTQATLSIQSLQGDFDRFQVRCPPGTERPSEGALNGAQFEFVESPEEGTMLKVRLQEPTTVLPDLALTSRRPTPAPGKPFWIEGFTVLEAERQTGQVAIRRDGDWSVQSDHPPSIQRIDVASLPVSVRKADVLAAYEYSRQPFELKLEFHRVEPRVTVDPKYTLVVESDRVSLEGWFEYSVERGGLLGVQLAVPAGWEVDEIGPMALVDPGENALREGDRLNLQFLTRTTGRFRVHLRAHRSFDRDEGPLEVAFPVPTRATVFPAMLAVVAASNVDLAPSFETMPNLAPSRREDAERLVLPSDLPAFHRDPIFFRVAATGFKFRTDVTVQAQRTECDSEVRVELTGARPEVRQTLSCDIAFAPLSEVPLLVPESLAESLRVQSKPGTAAFLQREPETTSEGMVRMKAVFGQQHIGPLDLVLTFDLPVDFIDPQEDSELTVPFVMPAEGSPRRNRVRISVPPTTAVELRDEHWAKVPPSKFESSGFPPGYEVMEFVAAGGVSQLNLVLRRRTQLPSPSLVVSRAWIRVIIGRDGSQDYRSLYRLTTSDSALVVRPDADFERNSFRFEVDGTPVTALEQNDGGRRIPLPSRTTPGPHVLTVFAQRRPPSTRRLGKRTLEASLEFPSGAHFEQTYWQVHLPASEYLIASPAGVTGEWNWRRIGLTWVRTPRLTNDDLSAWIHGRVDGDEVPLYGNVYLLGQVGASPSLAFRFATPPLLILVASGTAFFLGILPLYFSVARNLLVWLALGVALTLAGAAYPGAAPLFLQSSVLGAALVLVASAIKRVLDRRHRGALISVEAASGFSPLASTLTHPQPEVELRGSTASALAARFEPEPEPESHA